MPISSLFAGMEAYLDGDVEINNNVGTPEGDAEDAEVAEQTAEVASDTADASSVAKDNEVASQMLSCICDMYDHVKQFGIDKTFVSLYNRHGELDRVCGMRFPSYESMDVVGDRYSRYSTAFIAAMEDEKEGLWAKFKKKAIRKTNKNIPKLYAQLLSLQRKGDKIDKRLADTIRKDMSKFTTVLVNNRTNINEHILPAINKSRADNNITQFDDDLYRIAMTSS